MIKTRTFLITACAVGLFAAGHAWGQLDPYAVPYGIQWNYVDGSEQDEQFGGSMAASPDGSVWIGVGYSSPAASMFFGDTGVGGGWNSGHGQISPMGVLLQGQTTSNIPDATGFGQQYTREHLVMQGTSAVLGWDGPTTATWPSYPQGSNGGDLMQVRMDPSGNFDYYRSTALLTTSMRNETAAISQTSDTAWFAGGYQGVGNDIVTAGDSAVTASSTSYSAYIGRRNADGTLVGPAKQTEVIGRGNYSDMAVNEGSNVVAAVGYALATAGNGLDFDGDGNIDHTLSSTNTNGYIGFYNATTMAPITSVAWNAASATQQPTDIAATSDGGFVVVGVVTDSKHGTNPSPGTPDTVVEKYNSAGVLQWSYQSQDTDNAVPISVQVDTDGNIYVGERLDYTRDGNYGPILSGNHRILKLDSTGSVAWMTGVIDGGGTLDQLSNIGVYSKDAIYAIAETNPVDGTVWTHNNVQYGTGNDRDILVQKFIPGDVTGDGLVNDADLNAVGEDVLDGTGTNTTVADFSGNGVIDKPDLDYFIQNVFGTDYGDADLDGVLDVVDLDLVNKAAFNGDPYRALIDMDDDGSAVDGDDVDGWLAYAASVHGLPNPYGVGDANLDGQVNGTDLALLAVSFGDTSGVSWAIGDFNGDNSVNGTDLALLASSFGYDANNPAATFGGSIDELATAVPEPTSIMSIGLIGTIALIRRRR